VEAVVTDTENEIREFARVQPVDATPEMARFIAAMRRLQDIAVSTNPDAPLWNDTAELLEDICNDVLGYGPLEPLLARDDIAAIMVNGSGRIFIEVGGKVSRPTSAFATTPSWSTCVSE